MTIRPAFRLLLVPALVACVALLPSVGLTQSPAPQPTPPAPQQPSPPAVPQPAPPPPIKRIEISGNTRIPAERILAAVTETKPDVAVPETTAAPATQPAVDKK